MYQNPTQMSVSSDVKTSQDYKDEIKRQTSMKRRTGPKISSCVCHVKDSQV